MDIQADGVVISARPWKESDKMLSVFCDDGKVYDVVARGALKHTSKLKFATQLFSFCRYTLSPSKAGYYILSGASFGEISFLSLASDPDCFSAACLVCEAAAKSAISGNRQMYAETVAALGELCDFESADRYLVCLRVLLSAFISCGYCGEFGQGERGRMLAAVSEARAGEVSRLDLPPEKVRELFKAVAGRFEVRFEKLNSLSLLI